jgi:prepilin-type N-terminal cleavage/methylation domain-containing protein
MNKNRQKGFTLLELLIVVAIIGLLASLILVGLTAFRTRGRDARRVADLKQVQNGLEVYYTKNLRYPCNSNYAGALDSWEGLTTILTTGGIGISQISQDPLGENSSYGYATNESCQNYVMVAGLEDPDSRILDTDLDGSIFGIDCDDPSYCVQF